MENKTDDYRPESYTRVQIERRQAEHDKQYKDAEELFFRYLEYYEANYPNSKKNIEWNHKKASFNIKEGNFEETLDKCSELELYNILTVLDYTRKEEFAGNMKEHTAHLNARALITNRIPGFKLQEKLTQMKNEQHVRELEITKLEKQIEEKRLEFAETHKDDKGEELQTDIFVCSVCGRQCASSSGLSSHQRYNHPELFDKKIE